MAVFKWTPKKGAVAVALAEGLTRQEVSEQEDVPERTIYNWLAANEFRAEVDRLSLMTGIASRAERLRIAQRVVRKKTAEGVVSTEKDLLDWLKFAQSETDGIKLGLTALLNATGSMADSGSDREGGP